VLPDDATESLVFAGAALAAILELSFGREIFKIKFDSTSLI
jgi:hypothetical protein